MKRIVLFVSALVLLVPGIVFAGDEYQENEQKITFRKVRKGLVELRDHFANAPAGVSFTGQPVQDPTASEDQTLILPAVRNPSRKRVRTPTFLDKTVWHLVQRNDLDIQLSPRGFEVERDIRFGKSSLRSQTKVSASTEGLKVREYLSWKLAHLPLELTVKSSLSGEMQKIDIGVGIRLPWQNARLRIEPSFRNGEPTIEISFSARPW